MKKTVAILLVLVMTLTLAACGGNKNPENDNEPSKVQSGTAVSKDGFTAFDVDKKNRVSDMEITGMKMSRQKYGAEETIAVTVSWTGTPAEDAWIGIIPADVAHGSEEENDAYDIYYLYFTDMKSGDTFTFETPALEAGKYTMRVNDSDAGGAELAWCAFSVTDTPTVETDETTEPKSEQPKAVANDGSKLGVLQTVAEQQSFVIKGLYLTSGSGQHKYERADEVSAFGVDGLNSEYELNEWIAFYIDTDYKSPIDIYIVRNDAEADYSKITEAELEAICNEKGYPVLADVSPDAENFGSVGEAYVNPDSSEPDLFNAFFVANGKVCYMVELNLIAQTTAE